MGSTSDLGQEYLNSLMTLGAQVAKDVLGVSDSAAEAFGEQLALRVAEEHGGTMLYIAKGRFVLARRSHERIISTLRRHQAALPAGSRPLAYQRTASEIGCSVPHVYRIERKVIEEERVQRQAALPLG